MNMAYGLLTGDDFNWTTNVPFPHGRGYTEPFFTNFPDKEFSQLEEQTNCTMSVSLVSIAKCAVTVEGDRIRDLGSPC